MELNGYYGRGTECTVFYHEGWYAVEGSTNINYTQQRLEDGVDVEQVIDLDYMTATKPIECLSDLVNEVVDVHY